MTKQDLIEAIRRLPESTSQESLGQIAEKISGIEDWERHGIA